MHSWGYIYDKELEDTIRYQSMNSSEAFALIAKKFNINIDEHDEQANFTLNCLSMALPKNMLHELEVSQDTDDHLVFKFEKSDYMLHVKKVHDHHDFYIEKNHKNDFSFADIATFFEVFKKKFDISIVDRLPKPLLEECKEIALRDVHFHFSSIPSNSYWSGVISYTPKHELAKQLNIEQVHIRLKALKNKLDAVLELQIGSLLLSAEMPASEKRPLAFYIRYRW